MSIDRPSSLDAPSSPGGPDRVHVQEETRSKLTHLSMATDRRAGEIRVEQSVGQWAREAQGRMASDDCHIKIGNALGAVENLPQSMKSQWKGNLLLLQRLVNQQIRQPLVGDPVGVLRLIASLRSTQLPALENIANATNDPAIINAAQIVANAFTTLQEAVGAMHPNVNPGRAPTANTGTAAQESNLLRTGIFLGAGSIAIGTGMLAFFAKPSDRNILFPVGYGVAAALAAGYGNFSMNGTERLGEQVRFLVDTGSDWRTLRDRYDIAGPNWADFIRNLYGNRQRSALFAKLFRPGNQEARAEFLAMAPAGIQGALTRMFESGEGRGTDLRKFLGLLQTATSREAQDIVIRCLQESR